MSRAYSVQPARIGLIGILLLSFSLAAWPQHNHAGQPALPHAPVTLRKTPLREALTFIREGKTHEARAALEKLREAAPGDPEILFQIGRAYLLDFHTESDVTKRRVALNLAMENLGAAIAKDPNHIPSLRAKAIIHARAELLHYNPDLAYEYAARVAKAEPHASEYLLTLTDWMSGEVRFTDHGDHRVPHDPLLGLDRSIAILDQLLDHVVPFSNEETAAYFQMGKTLSRRGSFQESLLYFRQAFTRATLPTQKIEALRESGAANYRMGDYGEAARNFYEAAQWSNNDIDRWLLKTAMDQMPGPPPPLPKEAIFPAARLAPEKGADDAFRFKDIAPELGLNRLDGNGTCSWADIDGDGDLDLFLAGAGTELGVYRNDGRAFTEVTGEVGLKGIPSGYSLNLVDYDNDGDPDLYVSLNGWSGPLGNRLFRNTEGRFEDVTARSGAGDEGDGFVSLWGDLDNDGWLDLVIANGVLKDGSTPQVYKNNKDGTFSNVTKAAGIDEPTTYGIIGAALGDYDKDGDLDIFFNGLDNAPNRLYRNEGNWKFVEVSRPAGVTQPPHNGFVSFFVDYDNDGYPDLLTTSLAPWDAVLEGLKTGFVPSNPAKPELGKVHPDSNRLFRNNRNGTFTDVRDSHRSQIVLVALERSSKGGVALGVALDPAAEILGGQGACGRQERCGQVEESLELRRHRCAVRAPR